MSRFGKKGYIRTLEAIIAVVVVLLFTVQILPRTISPQAKIPASIEDSQQFIISIVSLNETVRDCVISKADCDLKSVIEENLPADYAYAYKICDQTECLLDNLPSDKSIYVKDVFITPASELQKPKIFKIFMWEQ